MFFNEAEGEGAAADPAGEELDDEQIDVPGHQRAKRGRTLAQRAPELHAWDGGNFRRLGRGTPR
jgi:hypothetical protein